MSERILVISDVKEDQDLFDGVFPPAGFDIKWVSHVDGVDDMMREDNFSAIVADYDLVGDSASRFLGLLQENRSRSCFILYGDNNRTAKIPELLQMGAYSFVPRNLISERIYDTIQGGLENRKAFIEILRMIDELKVVNERIEEEKKALRIKNQELGLINRISAEVSYARNWENILPRILDAGILDVVGANLLGLFYNMDSKWNLVLHFPEGKMGKEPLEKMTSELIAMFSSTSGIDISREEIELLLLPSKAKKCSQPLSLSKECLFPMTLAGTPLGMLLIHPKKGEEPFEKRRELMSTISNILAISLENAQEFKMLQEMAITDGLTGIYNHKGFWDFLQKEFLRAKRNPKPISLIMIDVDNFKVINDSYGHQAGDYVLRELAGCLKDSARKSDIVARYGGDEFAILLPETGKGKAEILMKRILDLIHDHDFLWETEKIGVEVSYGIATTSELKKGKNEEEFIGQADGRLYRAKRSRDLIYPKSRTA